MRLGRQRVRLCTGVPPPPSPPERHGVARPRRAFYLAILTVESRHSWRCFAWRVCASAAHHNIISWCFFAHVGDDGDDEDGGDDGDDGDDGDITGRSLAGRTSCFVRTVKCVQLAGALWAEPLLSCRRRGAFISAGECLSN